MPVKHIKSLIAIIALFFVFAYTSAQYCIPTSTFGTQYDTYINGVELGTISNISSGSIVGPSYNDYTSMSTEINYSISTELKITGSPYYLNMYFYAWIDYNHDGDFNDSGELLGSYIASSANQTNSIFFIIPPSAKSGATRLRITTVWNDPAYLACGDYEYGETEDYTVALPDFTLINTGIPGVWHTSNSLVDIDNDGDLDVFINGKTYLNNGNDTFTYIDEGIPNYSYAYQDWSDYDNDGDIDVLLTGYSSGVKSRVYRNNDDLTFTEIDYNIISISDGSVEWIDINNDSFQDIIITGVDENSEPVGKIYLNNGNDEFIDILARISCISYGTISVGDYNNDGYIDLLMVGRDIHGNNISKVYKNQGDFSFIELNTDLPGSSHCYADWGDYDNDGDLDILLAGYINDYNRIVGVYKNTGDDTFVDIELNLPGEEYGAGQWGDYDNDGDLDILISGGNSSGRLTKLYINLGNDLFEDSNIPLPGTYGSYISWGDYDIDGDLDFLLTGGLEGNIPSTNLFRNNTNKPNSPPSIPDGRTYNIVGNRLILKWDPSFDNETPSKSITYNVIVGSSPGTSNILRPNSNLSSGSAYLHEQGNSDADTMLILHDLPVGVYYWRVQAIDNISCASVFSPEESFEILEPFSEIINPIEGLYGGELEFADIDNDNDLDLYIQGKNEAQERVSSLYENNGSGSFSLASTEIFNLCRGGLDWGDYDNDGDIDLVYGGDNETESEVRVYRNDGNWNFTNINLPSFKCTTADWGDIDNDGDLDLLLVHYTHMTLLRNEGNDQFVETGEYFQYIISGHSVMFADIDNDFDQDIIISGYYESCIFLNNGKGNFSKSSSILPPSASGSIDLGDYDNDGDLDILLSGNDQEYNKYTRLLRNDLNEQFTEINSDFRGIERGLSAWADFDSDSNLDVLITGSSGSYISKIFMNQGNDVFTELESQFTGFLEAEADIGDINNDFNLDFIISGQMYSGKITRSFINNLNHIYDQTEAPSDLVSQSFGYGIKLSWEKVPDLNGNTESMTYNVRIGSTPGGYNIKAPMSDLSTGYRRVPKMGNAQKNNCFIIDSLPEGTYYWSVQAIDNAFRGGQWTTEQSFDITVLNADFEADTVCFGHETNFADLSLSSGSPISSWTWDFGDGTFSTLQNPIHQFPDAGNYSVKLVIHSSEYIDSISKEILVKPKPDVSFTSNIACQGEMTSFTNLTDYTGLTISSWEWDFGDGSSSSLENPGTHGYLIPGIYSVKLAVVADNNCIDSLRNDAEVGAYPSSSVSVTGDISFCEGDSSILSVEHNENYLYQWKISNVDISNADSSVYVVKSSGDYSIEVINPTGNCTSTSAQVPINVTTIPSSPFITANGNTSFCQGDSVELSVTNNPDYSYAWKLNGGAIGINTNKYYAKSSGNYTLEVSNYTGCVALSSNSVDITVIDIPTIPSINLSGPTSFCAGDSVIISVTNNPAYTYQWKNEFGNISGSTTNEITVVETGTYNLEVSNSSNCSVETVPVIVTVSESPSIPVIVYSGLTTFCNGDSIQLSVTNNTSLDYQWKLNTGAIGIDTNIYYSKSSGNYTLEVSNFAGCVALSSNSVDVTVNEMPDKPVVSLSGLTGFCEGDSLILSADEHAGLTCQWCNENGEILNANSNQYVTYSSGSFYLDITNSSNCTNTSNTTNVLVTEMPLKPVVNTTGYDVNDCPQEKMITLSVDQPTVQYDYQWQRNGVPIDGETESSIEDYLNEGDYSVIADNNGCANESDITGIYYDPELPEKPGIIATGPNVWYLACTNDNAQQYEWYYNNEIITGADEYLYVANQTLGTYFVKIAEENGCFVASDAVTIPLSATGIDDVNPFAGLKIYPNPTPGMFTIEMDNNLFGELITRIFSQNAIEILNIKFEKSTQHFIAHVDLSGQGKGVYLITFTLDKYKAERKIVVE